MIQKSVKKSISKNESWGLFLLILFAILREGFEIIILLFKEIKNGELNFIGVSSGAIVAIIIIYFIFALGKKIPLKQFFASTTLLLVFIAAGLIAYGTHEVEEYLVDSGKIQEENISRVWDILQPVGPLTVYQDFDKIWDYKLENGNWHAKKKSDIIWYDISNRTVAVNNLNKKYPNTAKIKNSYLYSYNEEKGKYYHILHDKGKVGDFLKGFFGYNSNPNYIEFFLWLFFLIFGIKKWANFYYLAPPKK